MSNRKKLKKLLYFTVWKNKKHLEQSWANCGAFLMAYLISQGK